MKVQYSFFRMFFWLWSWVIIFGLHSFDLILAFNWLFLPGIFRITDLVPWSDVSLFLLLELKPCQTNVLQLPVILILAIVSQLVISFYWLSLSEITKVTWPELCQTNILQLMRNNIFYCFTACEMISISVTGITIF